MNRYKFRTPWCRTYPTSPSNCILGEYTAVVEASSASEAERKALDELIKANVGYETPLPVQQDRDLGPIERQPENSPL